MWKTSKRRILFLPDFEKGGILVYLEVALAALVTL